MEELRFEIASPQDAEKAADLFLEGKGLERSMAISLFLDEFSLCETFPDKRVYFICNKGEALIAYAGARFYDQHKDEDMYGTSQLLPTGWYLRGLKVHPTWRRTGIATELTRMRLVWLAGRADSVHVFLNDEYKENLPMYHDLGFKTISRGWDFLSYDHKRPEQRGILLQLEL